ncbi:Histonelysine Nmethyltransferase SETD7like [Caligus rogercresseyi]|uniref:Histonelysine Nmethyltransferase SETD7like n=1 Tax=Caligus rogercresseyi TaxID=217165 RepID=A0A7T8KI08_CALRO|nr:Histonelysine Nmethyltransferase SETD7like [Caligus rogercresseyi]
MVASSIWSLLVLLVLKVRAQEEDGIPRTHELSLEKIRSWVQNMDASLAAQRCSYPSNGEAADKENIFIQSVIRGHPRAESDFAWDGKLDAQGYFVGRGTIKLGITGTFKQGSLQENDTIIMTIDAGPKGAYQVESTIKNSVLHGAYKISYLDGNKWGVGRIDGGRRDIELRQKQDYKCPLQNSSHCYMHIKGQKIYPYFSYNIANKTRHDAKNVDLSSDEKSICSQIDDRDISSSINSYFNTILDNFTKYFHLRPHPSALSKRPIQLISRLDHVEGNIYEAMFTFTRKTFSEFIYTGDLDEEGRFHGFGILDLSTKNQCIRGKCSIPEINVLSGSFTHGILEGAVSIISEERVQMTAAVAKNGVLHGRVLTKGMICHYPYFQSRINPSFNYEVVRMNGLGFYGYYLNGRPAGSVWYGMVGFEFGNQGVLHGRVDADGKLTGSNISYIYPNHINVLHGDFQDKFMKAATYKRIMELYCNEDSVLEVKSVGPSDSFKKDDDTVYFYDPLPIHPLQDPYEADSIYLAKSSIPNSGNGLYARRAFKKHEVVAWYSGKLYGFEETQAWDAACRFNSSLSKKAIDQCYKYRISTYHGALIDIPKEYDDDSQFRATLGHKINNGFGKEVNTAFHQSEHPRFGNIVNILATRPIVAGEELLVNYGYTKGTQLAETIFAWYFKAQSEYLEKHEGKS